MVTCNAFECCNSSLFSDKKTIARYRRNWIAIFFMTSLTGLTYFISIPSLHQFVTSSTHPEDKKLQPGLGLSETWYAVIVSMQSVGEFLGAMIFGTLSRRVYIKYLFLVGLVLAFSGGILFGVGLNGWMLLFGRLLIGWYGGAQLALWRVYVGETSEMAMRMLPKEKQEKSMIKYTNFFLAFTVGTVNIALGPALAIVVAEIPIDQFRWPGYLIAIIAALLFVLTLVMFWEEWDDLNRKSGSCGLQKVPVPGYTLVYILITYYLVNLQFSVSDTLQNPIIADNFGLKIAQLAYIFVGIMLFYFISNLFIYIMQHCKVDNRIIVLIAFTFSLVGGTILADWQSVNGDPCRQITEHCWDNSSSNSSSIFANTDFNMLENNMSCSVFHNATVEELFYNATSLCSNEQCVCDAINNVTDYQCFWNPLSRVTGQYCERCRHVCLSETRSLNFIQLIIGTLVFAPGYPMSRITLTVVASDALGSASQGLFMGAMVSTSSLAKITGPLLGDALYIAVDHRTWLIMGVLTLFQLIVLIGFLVLYRTFKPKKEQQAPPPPINETDKAPLLTNSNKGDYGINTEK